MSSGSISEATRAVSSSIPLYDHATRAMRKTFVSLRQLQQWHSKSKASERRNMMHTLGKREMSHGAIAGTVVGVVIAVILAALCLYPVIKSRIRRKSKSKISRADAEAAIDPNSNVRGDEELGNQRISSNDSFKQQDEDGTRGHLDKLDTGVEFGNAVDSARSAATFLPLGDEYMPQDIEDDQPGILKGTSADYYRLSIPSEALGMVNMPEDTSSPALRSLSRTSTFSSNFRHMFRHKSGRTGTINSLASNEAQSPITVVAASHAATPTQHVHQAEDETIDSPQNFDPPTFVPASLPTRNEQPTTSVPQSPLSESRFKQSPSPPIHPAPGTVNPMDIMAPSTQSELWHRTEHELYFKPREYGEPFHPSAVLDGNSEPHSSLAVEPGATSSQSGVYAQSEGLDVIMDDDLSRQIQQTMQTPEATRYQSIPSEQSTPLLPTFTDVSAEATPSTQIDTPSPESSTAYDARPNISPRISVLSQSVSPRSTDAYRCDEPGCHQVFDQPHKLRHHQRYHSKDHKCPYDGCDKGFGTKTHLQRHINDRHEKKKKFHCSMAGCDYSRGGGKAFPRKDNWKRHMTKIHGLDHQQLPEPVEIDVEMTGT